MLIFGIKWPWKHLLVMNTSGGNGVAADKVMLGIYVDAVLVAVVIDAIF
jgi:hypothetical protein